MEHPLRAYRQKHDITLEQLAKSVGTSKGFLSKIENGRQAPSLSLIKRLVAATQGTVTANDFLVGSPRDASQ